MLQGCELQVNEDLDCYPKDVTHVYTQNHYCDEWNNKRITSLQGDKYECVAFDSKKDHCTELTTINISLKPQRCFTETSKDRKSQKGVACEIWCKSYAYNKH